MKKLQEHLKKWLLLYVSLAMIIGVLLGKNNGAWIKANQSHISVFITVMVFLIIYPMMVNIKLESLAKAGKNIKPILLSLLYNFLWAPVLGWLLVKSILAGEPTLSIGFLLVMVVPCSSMSIGYTGLSKGDLELSTIIVALSFVLAVVFLPLWMTIFAHNYHIVLPLKEMLKSVLLVLILPIILGYLTRILLIKLFGEKGFIKAQPLFPTISLLAMYGIVFAIFFLKATMILDKWQLVLLLLLPNAIFIGLSLFVFTILNKRLGLSYEENMAVVFTSTGKNNGTAIAIASMAFSPMVAIPAATMPIFQIILMVFYLKIQDKIKKYFNN